MNRSYAIWPLRFSPQAPAMIDFYTRLGLRPSLGHASGTFATFAGRSGTLGVHDANRTESGAARRHTSLNLVTDDVKEAAAELDAIGYRVRVWDETYGAQGVMRSRDGLEIGLNEDEQADLYGGYYVHKNEHEPTLDVVAVCDTSEMKAEADFFAAFGFTAPSYDDPWWIGLRAGPRSGVIGIHHHEAQELGDVAANNPRTDDDLFGPPYLVRIGFETHEPLQQLADHLHAAGLAPTLVDDEHLPRLVLTDPDGETVEIHPAH